jgi:hypothetical protein
MSCQAGPLNVRISASNSGTERLRWVSSGTGRSDAVVGYAAHSSRTPVNDPPGGQAVGAEDVCRPSAVGRECPVSGSLLIERPVTPTTPVVTRHDIGEELRNGNVGL